MNSKNVALVLRIDSVISVLSGLNALIFYRPVATFIGLPDITPTLYPRVVGAMMIGLGVILWMAARNPEGMRDVIPGGIVARVLGMAVIWAMILVARIKMPLPGGIPVALGWGIASVVLVALLVLEGLFWWNTRPKAKSG